jgi:hypothetical protein
MSDIASATPGENTFGSKEAVMVVPFHRNLPYQFGSGSGTRTERKDCHVTFGIIEQVPEEVNTSPKRIIAPKLAQNGSRYPVHDQKVRPRA